MQTTIPHANRSKYSLCSSCLHARSAFCQLFVVTPYDEAQADKTKDLETNADEIETPYTRSTTLADLLLGFYKQLLCPLHLVQLASRLPDLGCKGQKLLRVCMAGLSRRAVCEVDLCCMATVTT